MQCKSCLKILDHSLTFKKYSSLRVHMMGREPCLCQKVSLRECSRGKRMISGVGHGLMWPGVDHQQEWPGETIDCDLVQWHLCDSSM